MKTGRRMFDCELSTIDSTFVIAGALTAAEYFNRDTEKEGEIRDPLWEGGYDIRTIQELPGHEDVKTTNDLYPCTQPWWTWCQKPG